MENILEIKDLCVAFGEKKAMFEVVSNAAFFVPRGGITALVGESGCGKSVSCLALTGLLDEKRSSRKGTALFCSDGTEYELIVLKQRQLRRLRGGKIAYIFQEPASSLNPVFRVGDQIAEAVRLHCPEISDVRAKVVELIADVGIPDPEKRCRAYPHELSGGMQQRIMIAMALAGDPQLLIADEPTTALDVTIQAQILELLQSLSKERGMSIILVTHNLGIVSEMADEVAVMYAGHIVERAPASELFANPQHPYTKALLEAVPQLGANHDQLKAIPGIVPIPQDYPSGCRFCERCSLTGSLDSSLQEKCKNTVPAEILCADKHYCRCFGVNKP